MEITFSFKNLVSFFKKLYREIMSDEYTAVLEFNCNFMIDSTSMCIVYQYTHSLICADFTGAFFH